MNSVVRSEDINNEEDNNEDYNEDDNQELIEDVDYLYTEGPLKGKSKEVVEEYIERTTTPVEEIIQERSKEHKIYVTNKDR